MCEILQKKVYKTRITYLDEPKPQLRTQDAQLSQRDRAAGCVQFSPKVEDWNWETIFYGHYRSYLPKLHVEKKTSHVQLYFLKQIYSGNNAPNFIRIA